MRAALKLLRYTTFGVVLCMQVLGDDSSTKDLLEVDTYYLTFEVHFTIEFAEPMENLVAQSKILAVIGHLFPTKASSSIEAEESNASTESQGTDALVGEEPGKMTRDQLEKQIKRLQSFLIKKK